MLVLRAYLSVFPGAFWGDPLAYLAPFGFTGAVDVIVVADAFEHVVGPARVQNPELRTHAILPSQSPAFRSLARCIADRDGSLFEAGESNLDWRQWAVFDDEGLVAKPAKRPSAKAKLR